MPKKKTYREKNPESADFLMDRWRRAASDAADAVKCAAMGYVIKRPVDPDKLLSDGQKDAGWTVEPVNGEKMLKYSEYILNRLTPG